LKAEIFSFARASKKDIDAVVGSDADAVFLVVPSSEIHMKHKLRKKHEDILKLAEECIEYAKDHGLKVEFGAEDATRSEKGFLKKLIEVSVNAGADIVTPCDTVGVLTPEKAYPFYLDLAESFPNVVFGVHCHDDFGMAVANSLAALRAGAKEVHTTINGIGERAGNAALEEVVVALELLYGIKVPLKMNLLYEASLLVSKLTGVPVQPNKAVVGENAFAHESGIHTHAVLSNPVTYEPIPPNLVGRTRRLVVGKHAGSKGIKAVLNEMGIFPNEEQLKEIFAKVKMLGDKGKKVTDSDLMSIAEAVMNLRHSRPLKLEELTVVTGNKVTPTASVKLKFGSKVISAAAIGVGPVDAAINAIRRAVQTVEPLKLDGYYVKSISGGTDAIVEVVVQLSRGDITTTAWGAHEDIVMASVEAMLNGINSLIFRGSAKALHMDDNPSDKSV